MSWERNFEISAKAVDFTVIQLFKLILKFIKLNVHWNMLAAVKMKDLIKRLFSLHLWIQLFLNIRSERSLFITLLLNSLVFR